MCHFSIHQPQTSSTPSPLQERAGYCRLHRKPRTNGDSRAMQRGKRETSKIFKDLQYQLLPHLNISDLVGGIYSATDGSVDPTGLTTAYARGARPDKIQSGNILKISTRRSVGRGSSVGRLSSHQSVGRGRQGKA